MFSRRADDSRGGNHGRTAIAVGSLVMALCGCHVATSGTGHEQAPSRSAPSSPDFPSTSASTTIAPSPVSTAAPVPTTPTAAKPSLRRIKAKLAAQTPGQRRVFVSVPGGYQASSYDQHDVIDFWQNNAATTAWRRVGSSTYPYSPAIGGPADVTVAGALLSGMRHATFIVRGNFTGDGSGNAVAYTTGPRGWGAIKAEPDGNIGPSGQPVGSDRIGLSFGFAFVSGKLQTMDCPSNQPIAACGSNPVTKLWAWNGHDFSRA